MADFNYTGGVRFAPDKVVDVTADKDGNPTKACNPITGVCLEGGGESDFSTAKVTLVNATGSVIGMFIPNLKTIGDLGLVSNMTTVPTGTSEMLVPLYKGVCMYDAQAIPDTTPLPDQISGDVEDDEGTYYIKGDCTFTFGTI